ncbi:MAG: nucleotidyltransferase domain-containing protein, partial [Acidimicrobiia bacterium]
MTGERDYGFLWAWEPLRPTDLRGLLADLRATWWIAGGWALDLFLGRQTRTHEDLASRQSCARTSNPAPNESPDDISPCR